VQAVFAIDAKREIARSFTAATVLQITALGAGDTTLGLSQRHTVDTIFAVGTVLTTVAALAKTTVVARVASLAAEVPFAGIILALILMSFEKLIDAREELIEVECRRTHARRV